jgi:NTE family protein
MKTALILSGGGFKGAFQYGAIKYLLENDIKIDFVAGISAGALNGSLVASCNYEALDSMWELVRENGSSEIFSHKFIDISGDMSINWSNIYRYFFSDQNPITLLTKGGKSRFSKKMQNFDSLTNSDPLRKKLNILRLEDFKIPFLTGAVSLDSGELCVATNEDFNDDFQFRSFVESSACMPIICQPIKLVKTKDHNFTNLVDGGIRTIAPISQSINYFKETGEDWRIILINCNSDKMTPDLPTNIAKIGLRSLNEIALNQIFKNDLSLVKLINKFVSASGKYEIGGYKNYPIKVISPDGLDIGETLDCSKSIIEKRLNLGFKIAKKIFSDDKW